MILFSTFSNTNILFLKKKLTWRYYIKAKAPPTTKYADLIDNKKFAKIALNEHFKTVVIHIVNLETLLLELLIYLNKKI